MSDFVLHPRLAEDSLLLARESGCEVRLSKNAAFPWLLVVPEDGVEDLHELTPERFRIVTELIRDVSSFVADYFEGEKLNVACIGNMVRQMHIHIVSRSPADPAWPGTVWGHDASGSYEPERVEAIRVAFQSRRAL